MKYAFFLLAFGLLLNTSCKDDDDGPQTGNNVLNFDGENSAAPTLDQGVYEAAVRFPASITSDFVGRQILEIQFFLGSVPAKTEIFISEAGTSTTPGDIIYQADVSGNANVGSWNTHTLTSPVSIDGSDIWVSVLVDHPTAIATVGCDAGPAKANGDFIFDYGTQTWSTFRSYTNNESDINWNIRAILNE